MGSTYPSLQGRSRRSYFCNVQRGSLGNRSRGSVAGFTLNECLLNWIISLLQICNVHLNLPHFLWGWQLTLESDYLLQPPWKSWIRARLSIGVKTKGGLSPREWAAKLWPVHSVKQYNNVGKPRHTHQYVCVSQLTLNDSVLIKFHLQEVQKQAQLTCVIKKIGFLCVGAIICEGAWEGASWGARNILCLGSGCSNVGGFIRKNLSKTKFYVIFGLRNTIYKILQPKALNMNPINFNGDFQFPETIGIEEQAEWRHEEATRPIRRPPLLQDRPPRLFHRRTWTRPGELKGHPIERPCKASVWILVWTNQL